MALIQRTIQQIPVDSAHFVKLKIKFHFFNQYKINTQNAPQDSYFAALTTLPKIYPKILRRIQQNPENRKKKYLSKKNDFSSEYSRGHVEGTLYTPAEILLPDINGLCPRIPKKVEGYVFHQLFPKESSGHIKCSFEYPAKTFFDENPETFLEIPKKNFPELFLWTCGRQFWRSSSETSAKKSIKLRSKSGTVWKISFRENFLGTFPWTRRRQFWHSCKKKIQQIFRSTSQADK